MASIDRREEEKVEEPTLAEAPPRPTLEELHALVAAKRTEYEELRERHQQLWQQRQAGTLEREGYIDYLIV